MLSGRRQLSSSACFLFPFGFRAGLAHLAKIPSQELLRPPSPFSAAMRLIPSSSKDSNSLDRLNEAIRNLRHSSSSDQWTMASEEFMKLFNGASEFKKTELLSHLGKTFGVDSTALDHAISIYQRNTTATSEVKRAATPLYQILFQNVGNRFGGVKCICDLRAHLLETFETSPDPILKRVEEAAKELLTMWFCLSNLTLERLTWQSPADILHKVAKYEAVHPVAGITDLQRRVGAGRRCFLFSHEAMPREPLVVVHVALVREISDNLQEILKGDEEDRVEDDDANTAIYYSISSTQKGLTGIDLGNLLIKGVVEELERDLPRVKTHATLSPIPGFRAWVLRSLRNSDFGEIVDEEVVAAMSKVTGCDVDTSETTRLLLQTLSAPRLQPQNLTNVREILMRLCAIYLLQAKRNGFALNPVANFHVRNGAEVHRLNWAADNSARGMERSFGIMVNYKYNLKDVHRNSEAYTSRKFIAAHDQILSIIDPSKAKL